MLTRRPHAASRSGRALAAGVVVTALALALAGCSSDDAPDATPGATATTTTTDPAPTPSAPESGAPAADALSDGRIAVAFEAGADGVNGTGAKLDINMAKTMGSYTGKLLPTGNASDKIEVNGKTYEVSIVDVVNPCVFVKAEELGLTREEEKHYL